MLRPWLSGTNHLTALTDDCFPMHMYFNVRSSNLPSMLFNVITAVAFDTRTFQMLPVVVTNVKHTVPWHSYSKAGMQMKT